MKRSTMDFFVGIFVLIGIICTLFLALKVAHITDIGSTKDNYILYANFNNIGSLTTNAPVKVSGYVVGRVKNITLNPKTYQARVTMNITQPFKFSSDSSAEILTTGLLGEQYIGLQSGATDDMLKNGDTITITSSALVLEQLIGKFMTSVTSK